MHPAFSVILLTTLIGAGQGLFLGMYATEYVADFVGMKDGPGHSFYIIGSVIALLLLSLGLLASFFHLGHPERAWRSASQWRTSWLSREVIVLPLLMLLIFCYGLSHYFVIQITQWISLSLVLGGLGMFCAFALFICTGMIYACIRFLQEWATPLTVINFTLLGILSGVAMLTSYAYYQAPEWLTVYNFSCLALLCSALLFRMAALIRNAKLRPKSNLQTAIGIKHGHIKQLAQGSMGGSFNTREFFHGAPEWLIGKIKWIFLSLVFAVPMLCYLISISIPTPMLLHFAALILFLGLLVERWYFFAQANHPQNLYYQQIS